MGLKEVLSKMKIVEMSPDEGMIDAPMKGSPPGKGMAGQPTDIRDLLGTLPPPPEIDEKSLAAAAESTGSGDAAGSVGGMDIPDFMAIYKAAGIQDPPHGYTAQKVLEILSSSDLANLDSRAKAAALAGFLRMNPTGPVPIADVVQDAVRRDQALDRFEDFLRTKLKARTEEIEKENARLQQEIDELVRRNREKMDANRRTIEEEEARLAQWQLTKKAEEEARLAQWQLTKKAEERRLFDAVAPFVETNPITTGAASMSAGAAGAAAPQPAQSESEAEAPEAQA